MTKNQSTTRGFGKPKDAISINKVYYSIAKPYKKQLTMLLLPSIHSALVVTPSE